MNFKTEYSADNMTLVINPRHPFTKIGIYNNTKAVFLKNINHSEDDLKKFENFEDQTEYRKNAVMKELEENECYVENIRVVITRGGLIRPVKSGVYFINEKMKKDLKDPELGEDVVNLGGLVADSVAEALPNAKAFIADPVVVDEYEDVARITGLPEIKRRSIFHALNQKHVARKYAKSIRKNYEDLNLIVAHLGTGITVGAHKKGQVIDANMGYDGDGPLSPIRAGSLPTGELIRLCYSGKYSEEEMLKKVSAEGGLYAHFGTFSGIDVDRKIKEGDEKAALVFEAMGYQVAKTIGSMFAVLAGEADAILITGPMAKNEWLVQKITERVEKLAEISVYPGSDDIETLAFKGLGLMEGEEDVLEY